MSKIDYTQRNAAIDILRALTMLLMIFVNDLWRTKGEPAWLNHATRGQDFLGLADIVLPCFLFAVGMSIPFAIETRFSKGDTGAGTLKHILTRTFALLIMGAFTVNTESGIAASVGISMPVYRILMVTGFILIWNLYPKAKSALNQHIYTALKVIGVILLIYLAIVFRDSKDAVFSARWWGILGIIGWAYVLCAIIYLLARDRVIYLAGAWIVIMLVCMFRTNTIEGNMLLQLPRPNFLDEFISIFRNGNGSSAAFTAAGMLFSVVCMKYAHVSQLKKAIFIFSTVAALLIIAFLSNKVWIISKLSGTPTWIFYCIAIGIGTYGLLSWLVEKGKASWFNVIKPAGTATLTCYLMPYVLYSLMTLFGIRFPAYLTSGIPGILNCIAFSFLTIGVTYLLGKIYIKLKI